MLHLFTNLPLDLWKETGIDQNKKEKKRMKVLPADWVGAMSWPALDGRISTGAGGELLSTTSTGLKNTVIYINSIQFLFN